jgi:predicted adenine nucleotide alpha hydrolase (AANH) superfamily ATPase
MKSKITKLLASPLEKVVGFFEDEQLSYRLKEIKPPFQNKDYLKNDGSKRVLKICKDSDNNIYQITWSFQYNS